MTLILASGSPRRRELLQQLRQHFRCQTSNLPERPAQQETASDYVVRLAAQKAKTVAEQQVGSGIVIGADTLIDRDGDILEKPADQDHFNRMLGSLAERDHIVRTAVSVVVFEHQRVVQQDTLEVATTITMGTITAADLAEYWATGEPQDKAAGYAIQGGAAKFVKSIDGSYTAVVGLPLYQTQQLLNAAERQLRSPDEC